jgi:hypothetical protein
VGVDDDVSQPASKNVTIPNTYALFILSPEISIHEDPRESKRMDFTPILPRHS